MTDKPMAYVTNARIRLWGEIYPGCPKEDYFKLVIYAELVLGKDGIKYYQRPTLRSSLVRVDVENQIFETKNTRYKLISEEMIHALFMFHPDQRDQLGKP